MEKIIFLFAVKWCFISAKETFPHKETDPDLVPSNSGKVVYEYVSPVIVPQLPSYVSGYTPSNFPILPQPQLPKIDLHAIIDENPLLAALLLSASLGLSPKPAAPNHPELLPINPYIALLLSTYGRYLPAHGTARGLYGYAAANNYHNNKPFGSYKVYEDSK